jgi:HAD superfamily hydrolase (TIGR01509 family)
VKLPRAPAAVVFDMDGLLFDTERLYGVALKSASATLGYTVGHDVFIRLIGTPWAANKATLREHYGPTFPTEELEKIWMEHFHRLIETDLPLKQGALELLDLLDELELPRAIATSSSRRTVDHHLDFHGLAKRFHQIVAHGDYAAGKPAPDPYLKAAERLGVAPGLCLALEDSHNGVRSAASAGMMAIMVPDLLPPSDEIERLCTLVVSDLHGVGRLIAPGTP